MADSVHLEIERKYDVSGQTSLPRLTSAPGVSQVRYRPPVALETLYFDTRERTLSANAVTLRRRIGGAEAGWHVKIGAGEHRIELQVPLTDDDLRGSEAAGRRTFTVPAEIADLVYVHTRGRELVPVLSMNTLRSVVDLMDPQGRTMAEVCDDQVAAMAAGARADSRVRHWREWEVEVVNPTLLGGMSEVDGFLDTVESALLEAGADRSDAGSKLEKVLGLPEDPLSPEATGDGQELQTVLTRTVRTQVRALKTWDPLVRRNVEDSVHQLRVTARTLRSVLQIYRPLLEPEATAEVNKALRTLGRLLSTARDAEVLRDQVGERLAALPSGANGQVADLIPGKTVRRLHDSKAKEYTSAHRKLVRRMRTPWYAEQLDLIDAYARDVPLHPDLTAAQRRKAVTALVPLATAQVDSVLDLADRARDEADPIARTEEMHEVRKEAKRLRYAVAAVEDAAGTDLGEDLAARMNSAKKLQNALGTHRDSVMFQEYVLEAERKAKKAGDDTFGYGILYAAELSVQDEALQKAEKHLENLHRDETG